MTTALTTRATAAQIDDIKYLLGKLEARGQDYTRTRKNMNDAWTAGQLDVDFAALLIKSFLDRLAELDTPGPAPSQTVTVPDGRYAVLTNDGHYAFYRVWNGDRAVCVYQQISDDEQRVARDTARGVLAKIADDLKEAACAYGREIGVCGVCGITLTNPISIARGMGDKCASKF